MARVGLNGGHRALPSRFCLYAAQQIFEGPVSGLLQYTGQASDRSGTGPYSQNVAADWMMGGRLRAIKPNCPRTAIKWDACRLPHDDVEQAQKLASAFPIGKT